mgnify:CR=1 FL=1
MQVLELHAGVTAEQVQDNTGYSEELGIGVEKIAQMPLLFGPDDLLAMTRLRAVFDPDRRANPHKVLPDAKVCVEARAPRRQVPI